MKPLSNSDRLLQQLRNISHWSFYRGVLTYHYTTVTTTGALFEEENTLCDACDTPDLRAIHERLPELLSTFNTYMQRTENGRIRVPGSEQLEALIAYLCAPLCLRTMAGSDEWVSSVFSLSWPSPEVPIRLWARTYVLTDELPATKTQPSQKIAPLPFDGRSKEILVDPLWLDGTFPGWRERLLVCSTLGLTTRAQVEYVFQTTKPEVVCSLPTSGLA